MSKRSRLRVVCKAIGVLALCWAISGSSALARPAQVILLRHAEKPDTDVDVNLSERGIERAQALVPFFTTNAVVTANGLPAALFAPESTRRRQSRRPYETLAPLARQLNLPIQTPVSAGNYAELARRVLDDPAYDGKTVVICWVHDYLPEFAESFGVKPPRWPASVYDRVWSITFHKKRVRLASLPQHLLPGDSPQ